jgi:hypothetical protein
MGEQTKKKVEDSLSESNANANPTNNVEQKVEATTPPPAPDPFDVSKLRLDQSFVESAGVKKLLTTVPVRKPHKQEFIRVRSDPAYRDAFAVIEWKEDREFYILTPEVARVHCPRSS